MAFEYQWETQRVNIAVLKVQQAETWSFTFATTPNGIATTDSPTAAKGSGMTSITTTGYDAYAEVADFLSVMGREEGYSDGSTTGTAYTLACDAGSSSITGVAASLKKGYAVIASAAAILITGVAVNFFFGYTLDASRGDFANQTSYIENFDDPGTLAVINTGYIRPDGDYLYLQGGAGEGNRILYRYTMPSFWDIGGAVYASDTVNLQSQQTYMYQIQFNAAGTRLYTQDEISRKILIYSVGTPFILSSVNTTPINEIDYSSYFTGGDASFGFFIRPEVNKLYILEGITSPEIREYTYNDVTGVIESEDATGTLHTNNDAPAGFGFSADGKSLYTADFVVAGNTPFFKYHLDIPWDVSSIDNTDHEQFDSSDILRTRTIQISDHFNAASPADKIYMLAADDNSDDVRSFEVVGPTGVGNVHVTGYPVGLTKATHYVMTAEGWGRNLLLNGSFQTADDWNFIGVNPATWDSVNFRANFPAGGLPGVTAEDFTTLIDQDSYQLDIWTANGTYAPGLLTTLGGQSSEFGVIASDGRFTSRIDNLDLGLHDLYLITIGTNEFIGEVDNVSLKHLESSHAIGSYFNPYSNKITKQWVLTADAGSINITGFEVTRHYAITADGGSYSITGSPAALKYSRVLTAKGWGPNLFVNGDFQTADEWVYNTTASWEPFQTDFASGNIPYVEQNPLNTNLVEGGTYLLEAETSGGTYSANGIGPSVGTGDPVPPIITTDGLYSAVLEDLIVGGVHAASFNCFGTDDFIGKIDNLRLKHLESSHSFEIIFNPYATDITKQWVLAAGVGSVTITGFDATLTHLADAVLAANAGSFNVTGVASNLEYHRIFTADPGAVSITGVDASLGQGYAVLADPGAVTINGVAVDFPRDYVFASLPGTYLITGFAATLTKTGAVTITADPGVFNITGVDPNLIWDQAIVSDAGAINITGIAANLEHGYTLAADPGSVDITGVAATFPWIRVLGAEADSYVITGFDATLTHGLPNVVLDAEAGAVVIAGSDAALQPSLGGLTGNAMNRFPTGQNDVVISLWHPITNQAILLDSNVCVEMGTSGRYIWNKKDLTTQPTVDIEYVYEMTDGVTIKEGLVLVTGTITADQISELYIRMDLNASKPNTYADDGSSIANEDFTLTKSDNMDGSFDIIKTPT